MLKKFKEDKSKVPAQKEKFVTTGKGEKASGLV